MSPKKHEPNVPRDQHMMENREIIKRMLSLCNLKPDDHVLEIGAGTGNLTKLILGKGAKVTAVEKDKGFEGILRIELGRERRLKLVFGNALFEMDKIKFNKMVSNLPYSICEPVMNKLAKANFDKAVLSVPERFARILTAKPGEGNYSKLSAKSQSFFDVEISFKIPRDAFRPEPRTESVVIVIKPLPSEEYRKHPEKYILKEIFLQQKKKLRNALLEGIINFNKFILGRNFTKNMSREVIKKMDIEENILGKKTELMSLGDIKKVSKRIRSWS